MFMLASSAHATDDSQRNPFAEFPLQVGAAVAEVPLFDQNRQLD